MPRLRHGYSHPILVLPVKMVELPQQHVNTTVPWLQTLPLPILANSSILNVAGICLWKRRHARKPVFFSYYFEILPPLLTVIVFFCYFLQYDDVFLIDLLDGCYHYLVLRDPVNDYSNSELLVKEYVSLKSKIRFGYACLTIFCYRSFLLWSIFSPRAAIQLKRRNPLCYVCFLVLTDRKICREKRWQLANCKLNDVNWRPPSLFYAHVILRSQMCALNHFTCTKINARKY